MAYQGCATGELLIDGAPDGSAVMVHFSVITGSLFLGVFRVLLCTAAVYHVHGVVQVVKEGCAPPMELHLDICVREALTAEDICCCNPYQ